MTKRPPKNIIPVIEEFVAYVLPLERRQNYKQSLAIVPSVFEKHYPNYYQSQVDESKQAEEQKPERKRKVDAAKVFQNNCRKIQKIAAEGEIEPARIAEITKNMVDGLPTEVQQSLKCSWMEPVAETYKRLLDQLLEVEISEDIRKTITTLGEQLGVATESVD